MPHGCPQKPSPFQQWLAAHNSHCCFTPAAKYNDWRLDFHWDSIRPCQWGVSFSGINLTAQPPSPQWAARNILQCVELQNKVVRGKRELGVGTAEFGLDALLHCTVRGVGWGAWTSDWIMEEMAASSISKHKCQLLFLVLPFQLWIVSYPCRLPNISPTQTATDKGTLSPPSLATFGEDFVEVMLSSLIQASALSGMPHPLLSTSLFTGQSHEC